MRYSPQRTCFRFLVDPSHCLLESDKSFPHFWWLPTGGPFAVLPEISGDRTFSFPTGPSPYLGPPLPGPAQPLGWRFLLSAGPGKSPPSDNPIIFQDLL